ncbi:MAG: class I SAM-dependent methyltransferase [Thermodesulfobacteriota bacterium]
MKQTGRAPQPEEEKDRRTKEPHYGCCFEAEDRYGRHTFGLMSNWTWIENPKHILFLFARYKFVARMLEGLPKVLEIGCADALATRIVSQAVGSLVATDFDPIFIQDAKNRMIDQHSFDCRVHDILAGPVPGEFDGAYSLDVIEHVRPEKSQVFVSNIVSSLKPTGVLIIGTPSLASQIHASPVSRQGHVNCLSHEELKSLLSNYFHNVFIFSMNDEVVHTGFYPMAHYLLALCCHKKTGTG